MSLTKIDALYLFINGKELLKVLILNKMCMNYYF